MFVARSMGLVFFLLTVAIGARATDEDAEAPILEPAPHLSAEQVVEAQLRGLQEAADPDTPADRGMRIVWNFAAPANQEATGPFERFDAMVRAAPFGVLVGHTSHDLVRLEHHPERPAARALIAVTHGEERTAWFVWMLSKPAEGERQDCWVTDGVVPVEPEPAAESPDQVV